MVKKGRIIDLDYQCKAVFFPSAFIIRHKGTQGVGERGGMECCCCTAHNSHLVFQKKKKKKLNRNERGNSLFPIYCNYCDRGPACGPGSPYRQMMF